MQIEPLLEITANLLKMAKILKRLIIPSVGKVYVKYLESSYTAGGSIK